MFKFKNLYYDCENYVRFQYNMKKLSYRENIVMNLIFIWKFQKFIIDEM